MSRAIEVDGETVRRWLNLLRHPIRLDTPEMRGLLRAHGRLPREGSPVDIGRAAARLLTDAIDRLAASPDAPAAERLPHAVLRTCFVEGAKLHQAATKLGLSERQLTRERGRAIALLAAQLSRGPGRPAFVPDEIPTVKDFVPRADVMAAIDDSLQRSRVANVHGPPGIGKTTVVARLAAREKRRGAVWWYRFRRSVNDTLAAVIFEMGQWLESHGLGDLAEYVAPNIADLDPTVAARIAIQTAGKTNALLVLDDYHIVEDDPAIAGFFDEAVLRTPTLRLITLSRHRPAATIRGAIEVPPFRLDQTENFMLQLGVRRAHDTVARIHAWTAGNPYLVRLSAAWLANATPQEIARGVTSLVDRTEVQEFLLDNVTELLDGDDRAVLEAASVFRGRFSDDALAYVAGLTRGAVQDASHRLARAYVATRTQQGMSAFCHPSVRDYVYERLDLEQRAALHLRAAAWFHRAGDEEETRFHRRQGGLQT